MPNVLIPPTLFTQFLKKNNFCFNKICPGIKDVNIYSHFYYGFLCWYIIGPENKTPFDNFYDVPTLFIVFYVLLLLCVLLRGVREGKLELREVEVENWEFKKVFLSEYWPFFDSQGFLRVQYRITYTEKSIKTISRAHFSFQWSKKLPNKIKVNQKSFQNVKN